MREPPSLVQWLVDVVREVISLYGRLGGSLFAAAISYRALFSLIPLATFVATILAEVLSSSRVDQQDLVNTIGDQLDLSPQGVARLDTLISSVPSPWSIAGLFTLGLALWGATGVMNSMQKTLAVVFDAGISRSLVRGRLVSGLLVLGALGIILAAVVLSMLENVARNVSTGSTRPSAGNRSVSASCSASSCPPRSCSAFSCCCTATFLADDLRGVRRCSAVPPPRSGSRGFRSASAGTSPAPPTSLRSTGRPQRSSSSSSRCT